MKLDVFETWLYEEQAAIALAMKWDLPARKPLKC